MSQHLDWLPIRTPSNVVLFVSSSSTHRPTEARLDDRGPAKLELAPMSLAEQDLVHQALLRAVRQAVGRAANRSITHSPRVRPIG